MTDPLAVASVSGVIGFLGGLALKYLGPKSRLVFWRSHEFLFQVPNAQAGLPPFNVYTHALTIQNRGRQKANNLQVAHSARPDHFKLFPALNYLEHVTPAGEHVITVPSLAHGEWLTIEFLSYASLPNLLYIRSDDGHAQVAQVLLQYLLPRWVRLLGGMAVLIGTGTLVYGILKGVAFLGHKLGLIGQ